MKIPQLVTQSILNRLAPKDEKVAVVLSLQGGGTSPYTVTGRGPSRYQFPYCPKVGQHQLVIPASLWNANKGQMARDVFTRQLNLKKIVPTTADWIQPEPKQAKPVIEQEVSDAPNGTAPVDPTVDPEPVGTDLNPGDPDSDPDGSANPADRLNALIEQAPEEPEPEPEPEPQAPKPPTKKAARKKAKSRKSAG